MEARADVSNDGIGKVGHHSGFQSKCGHQTKLNRQW